MSTRSRMNCNPVASRRAALANELRGAALSFACAGYPVFPCSPQKRPLVKGGFKSACRDPNQIRVWWKAWPLAMIGMPTGKASGVIVVDIDVNNRVDGRETLRRLGWVLDGAPSVRTPSGGIHFYFRCPECLEVRNSAGKLGPGIDIRGEGGYVILPPSRPTIDGIDYELDRDDGERHPMEWGSA